MSFVTNNEKIDKYLDELSDEYKKLLFNALLEKSASLEDLSVSELLRIDSEIKKPLINNNYRHMRRKRVLYKGGIAYIILGFFGFFINTFIQSSYISEDNIMSILFLAIGFSGIIIILMSDLLADSLFKNSNKNNSESKSLLEYDVIKNWRSLEGLANDININNKNLSSTSIIQNLYENKIINEEDKRTLHKFLQVRNDIVHSSKNKIDKNELQNLLKETDKIIIKIKKII